MTAQIRHGRALATHGPPDMTQAMTGIKHENLTDGTALAYREDGPEDLTVAASSGWAASGPTWRAPRRRRWPTGAERATPLLPLRLFGPWRIWRQICRWHHLGLARPVAGTCSHSGRPAAHHRGFQHGGWLAMLLYRELQLKNPRAAERIAGLVLLAPAADMTADLMWDEFSTRMEARSVEGVWQRPSPMVRPMPSCRLIDDGGEAPDAEARGSTSPSPFASSGRSGRRCAGRACHEGLRRIARSRRDAQPDQGRRSSPVDPRQPRLLCETVLRLAERADGITI